MYLGSDISWFRSFKSKNRCQIRIQRFEKHSKMTFSEKKFFSKKRCMALMALTLQLNLIYQLKFKNVIHNRIFHRILTLPCDQIEKRYKFINGLMEQTMFQLGTQLLIKSICIGIGAFQPSTFFAIVFFSFLLDGLNLFEVEII